MIRIKVEYNAEILDYTCGGGNDWEYCREVYGENFQLWFASVRDNGVDEDGNDVYVYYKIIDYDAEDMSDICDWDTFWVVDANSGDLLGTDSDYEII